MNKEISVKILVDSNGEVVVNPDNTITAVYSKLPNVIVGENNFRKATIIIYDNNSKISPQQ